jgi:ferredoxin
MPSPFGIRRRLKSLLGMGEKAAPTREEVPKVALTVVGPDGAEQNCTADVGNSVVSASNRMKRPIATGCADSTCGTCRIEVLEGAENVIEQSARERATLKDNGFPTTLRLGCRTELVKGAVKVKAFELT